jgi:hypothetical protein
MLVNEAPEAVNAKPTVDIVNFICFAEAPTVQYAVAGTKFLPPVTYPPVAEISAVICEYAVKVNVDALLEVLANNILNTPAPRVIVPLPIYFLALLYNCHADAAILNLLYVGV